MKTVVFLLAWAFFPALLSAQPGFAHLYDWRAYAFRFGNTVGSRSDHGVVHDFVIKLMRDPRSTVSARAAKSASA